jgi:hypothetical protein
MDIYNAFNSDAALQVLHHVSLMHDYGAGCGVVAECRRPHHAAVLCAFPDAGRLSRNQETGIRNQ